MENSAVGKTIKEYRKKLGLSLNETARRAQMPKSSLCDIENGRVKVPGPKVLYKLAVVFGIRIEDILKVPLLKKR